MGAIVASLLTKATTACRYNEFFSNEGREIEMLSSGCAVGIACTFSAPAGGSSPFFPEAYGYHLTKNFVEVISMKYFSFKLIPIFCDFRFII